MADRICTCDPTHPSKEWRDEIQPDLERAVEALGLQYGFGALMQTAQWLWQDRDPVAAHMSGKCVGSLPAEETTDE